MLPIPIFMTSPMDDILEPSSIKTFHSTPTYYLRQLRFVIFPGLFIKVSFLFVTPLGIDLHKNAIQTYDAGQSRFATI